MGKRSFKKECEPPPLLDRGQREMLEKHRERVRNAVAIVDNKPPLLNFHMYYKPKTLLDEEAKLQIIMAENKELLKRINIINRTRGVVDSHWKIKLTATSNYETREAEMKRITMDNYKIFQRLITQRPRVPDNKTLQKEWKRNLQIMEVMCRYPLLYKCPKENDLLSDGTLCKRESILPPSIKLKPKNQRPRCFLDVGIENDRLLGRIIIELYDDIVPQTATNFLALCEGTYDLTYKGCLFHCIIPGIKCQGGDITKFSGIGGVSIYGEVFPDENFILQHSGPGVLSMANTGPNSNNSQFNITFKRLLCLNGKNVVFGKIVRGLNNLFKIEELGARSGKPLFKVVIVDCGWKQVIKWYWKFENVAAVQRQWRCEYGTDPHTLDALWDEIQAVSTEIPLGISVRVTEGFVTRTRKCMDAEGQQFEHLM